MFYELVEEVQRDSPPFSATGNSIVQPHFLPCVAPVPSVDQHGYKPFGGSPGKLVDEQIHIYKCLRCGATDIPIPNSGFEITGEVRRSGGKLVFSAKKVGAATGVNVRPPGSLTSKTFKAAAGRGSATSRDFPVWAVTTATRGHEHRCRPVPAHSPRRCPPPRGARAHDKG